MAGHVEGRMKVLLGKREELGMVRRLSARDGLKDYCSNDYLGMARDTRLKKAIQQEDAAVAAAAGGAVLGSTGSRLLSGNNKYAMDLERSLADFLSSDEALLFNSGYSANLSVISSVPQKGDIVIYDRLCHNSILEGLKLGRQAKAVPFKHNDVEDLKAKLREYAVLDGGGHSVLVVVESVYSMDGDMAPLKAMCDVAQGYPNVALIVDEAHGTGVFGEGGRGVAHLMGVTRHPSLLCSIHTFGKAYGIHGAAVLGSKVLKSYLLNYARPLIFTTSLSLHSLISIKCSLPFIKAADPQRDHLRHLIKAFSDGLSPPHLPSGILIPSPSAIQSVIIRGNREVLAAASELRGLGYDVLAIRAPTVQKGTERLRIILHAHNPLPEVLALIDHVRRIALRQPAKM